MHRGLPNIVGNRRLPAAVFASLMGIGLEQACLLGHF